MTSVLLQLTLVLTTMFWLKPAQDSSSARFIQSWKKGIHQIEEKEFDVVVSKASPSAEITVRDVSRKPKYQLSIKPVMQSRGVIDSWIVELKEKKTIRSIFDEDAGVNLLQPSNDPRRDGFTADDSIGWMTPQCEKYIPTTTIPQCFAPPFRQKRIIQIEQFYVSLRVTGYEIAKDNADELSSLKIEIVFSNQKPSG
jgi:hypothetical protein